MTAGLPKLQDPPRGRRSRHRDGAPTAEERADDCVGPLVDGTAELTPPGRVRGSRGSGGLGFTRACHALRRQADQPRSAPEA